MNGARARNPVLLGLGVRGAAVGLRAMGLISRFALMGFLARYGSFSTIGAYGLIYGAALFVPPLLSFGLHYRVNRHLVMARADEVGGRLRDRLILHVLVFEVALLLVVVAGVAMPAVVARLGGGRLCLLAAGAALGELLLGEIHLVLVAVQRPLRANAVYFVRSAFWVGPFIVAGLIDRRLVRIEPMMMFWIGSQGLALLTFVGLNADWPWRAILRRPVEIDWLLRDPAKAASIWLGDVGNAASGLADRFVLGLFVTTADIGVYTFLWTLANGTYQLVFSGVVQAGFARFCRLARAVDTPGFQRLFIAEVVNAAAVMLLLGAMTALAMPLLARALHKSELGGQEAILLLLLAAFGVRIIADVVNYGLYAVGRDRALATINIALTPLVVGMDAVGARLGGIAGVAAAVLATFTLVLVARGWCLRDHLMAAARLAQRPRAWRST